MKRSKIETQSFLSTLWIFVLLNMIFRDLHQFASKGFIEELMSLDLREELVLIFGFVLEIPILMVVLSRILPDNANKWANLIAALITFLGLLNSLPSADMDDLFFAFVESVGLVSIIAIAWKLPFRSTTTDPELEL